MNVNAAMPVAAGPDTAVAKVEQNLFEHVAGSMRERGSAVPNDRTANPGNLVGEALGDLQGYLARVRHMGAVDAAAVNGRRDPKAMDDGSSRELAHATRPADSITNEVNQSEKGAKVDDTSLDRAAQRMLDTMRDSMRFGLETYLVVMGTTRLPKTVNTLLRGQ